MKKELRRTVGDERKITGVCGGIAKFFSLDPTIVRVVFAVLALCGSTGIILYIVLSLIIPEDDGLIRADYEVKHNCADEDDKKMNADGTGKNGWN